MGNGVDHGNFVSAVFFGDTKAAQSLRKIRTAQIMSEPDTLAPIGLVSAGDVARSPEPA
jgi:hypothetical protein